MQTASFRVWIQVTVSISNDENIYITGTFIYMYVCLHTFLRVHIFVCMYVFLHLCIYVCILVSMYAWLRLCICVYDYSIHFVSTYTRVSLNKFPDVFAWALLLIVHAWNSSPLRSNLLRMQCTCCTVPITSVTPYESPLVWACQWPSSRPLLSPQLTHKDSLWAWE